MKKYLVYVFSATLLLASCTDGSEILTPNYTGALSTDIGVSVLSDEVLFETTVVGVGTAKISLLDTVGGTLKRVLTETATVNGGKISETFTLSALGLDAIGSKAYIAVEAAGHVAPATVSIVSALSAPTPNKGFTTLEASTLADTLTFSVKTDKWSDTTQLSFKANYFKNGEITPRFTADPLTANAGKSKVQDTLSIAYLQSQGFSVGDTVNVAFVATYKGTRTDTLKHSFVITKDVFKSTASNTLSKLSTDDVTLFNGADSTATFYGLLTGDAFKGVEAALKEADKQPVLFFTYYNALPAPSGLAVIPTIKLQTLPSDSVAIWHESSDLATYKANNRVVAEATTFTTATDSLAPGYYALKIVVGTGAKAPEYYGYLRIAETSEIVGTPERGAKYTFNYASKRNYAKE
ncbi:hypothetical protein AGMMS49982_07710 [Bacteroidia bacterium]|nr:hypothetical protein AGMMS49982_07710 [Bacteroidia bacterium]